MNHKKQKQLSRREFADLLETFAADEPISPEEIAACDAFLQTGGFEGDSERTADLARRAQEMIPGWLLQLRDASPEAVVILRPK